MALNINYQGGVVNSDGDDVDCKYQAYVPSISTWSDIRSTDQCQYNVNYGDGDLKTQSGSVSRGEAIIIAFWLDSDSRNDKLTSSAVLSFIYDGNDNTVQDIMLMEPVKPGCNFYLQQNGLANISVSTSSYASLVTQWTYSDKTHYNRPSWYGTTIFGYLSITEDSFDFEDGFEDKTSHVYTTSGDKTVQHKVVNSYDLQSTCQKTIRIKYRPPTGGIVWSSDEVYLGDAVGVAAQITDPDSRITSIDHIFDGELVENNSETDYVYSETLSVFKVYTAKQIIYWNDGFDDRSVTVTSDISIQNTPPTVDLTIFKTDEAGLEGLNKAIVEASDNEGPISSLHWSIYYLDTNSILPNPYFKCVDDGKNNTFNLIYEKTTDMSASVFDLMFAIKGTYKIDVTATDDGGLTATDSQIITVDEVCSNPDLTVDPEELEKRIAEAIEAYKKDQQLAKSNSIIEDISKCTLVAVQDSLSTEIPVGESIGAPTSSTLETDISGEIKTKSAGIPTVSSLESDVVGEAGGEAMVGDGGDSSSISGS